MHLQAVHPDSVTSPSIGATSSAAQLALQSRTSIGGGISLVLLGQEVYTHTLFVTTVASLSVFDVCAVDNNGLLD